jgi:hypothetical protein
VTRNACVYTPVAAILHHAGVESSYGGRRAPGRVVTTGCAARCLRDQEAAERLDPRICNPLKFCSTTRPPAPTPNGRTSGRSSRLHRPSQGICRAMKTARCFASTGRPPSTSRAGSAISAPHPARPPRLARRQTGCRGQPPYLPAYFCIMDETRWRRRKLGLGAIQTAARYAHAVARDEWNRVDELPSARGEKTGTGK